MAEPLGECSRSIALSDASSATAGGSFRYSQLMKRMREQQQQQNQQLYYVTDDDESQTSTSLSTIGMSEEASQQRRDSGGGAKQLFPPTTTTNNNNQNQNHQRDSSLNMTNMNHASSTTSVSINLRNMYVEGAVVDWGEKSEINDGQQQKSGLHSPPVKNNKNKNTTIRISMYIIMI